MDTTDTVQTDVAALLSRRTEELRRANERFASTMAELERAYDITLEAFGDTLELHDPETAYHCKRVTAFSIALARDMGIPKEAIRIIARAAFLHDIGKIAIPPPILRKAGVLTPEEARIVREHCAHGYQMLRKIPFLAEAAEVVYAHHERWDGTGYPRGLMGNDIPLGARIVATTNTLDSITSGQPYRPAESTSAAREEIARWSGSQFDPEVVTMFLQIPSSIWEDLGRGMMGQLAARLDCSKRGNSSPRSAVSRRG